MTIDQVRAHALGVKHEEDCLDLPEPVPVAPRHRLNPEYRRRLIWFGIFQGGIVVGLLVAVAAWYWS